MKTQTIFTIDADNAITAFPILDEANASLTGGALLFTNEKEFAKVTAEWPISRFVETWNAFAGVAPFDKLKPVKKFENRAKATTRIWSAIQDLVPDASAAPEPAQDAPANPPATAKASRKEKAPKATKPAKAANATEPKAARAGSKKEDVIKMLSRKNGASNEEIREATDWQAHTVRGFIAGTLKKSGIIAASFKRENGDRAYRIA